MATFTCTLANSTGSVSTTPFFGLVPSGTTVAHIARVIEIGWSGESGSSVAMRTQVARPTTAGTGTVTAAGNVTKLGLANDPAAYFQGASAFGTVNWVLTTAGGSVLPFQSWNAYGGIVRWVASLPDEEIWLTSLATLTADAELGFTTAAGTGLGSYGVTWKE